MHRIIMKYTVIVLAAGIISLCFLSFFVFLYCDSGVHISDALGVTDYHYEPNQRAVNYQEGFGYFRMDENGYNNQKTYSIGDIDYLLLGSSHVEAANVNGNENIGAVLNTITDYITYNIGVSGHTIYHVADNLHNAVQVLQPSVGLIIETDTVKLDEKNMEMVCINTFPDIKVYDNGLLYYIQKYCPSIKFLFNKMELWKDAANRATPSAVIDYSSDGYQESLNAFLAKIRSDAGDLDVIIVYHSKTQINGDGNYIDPTDPDARAAFITACEANNITFLDMTESFESLYNEQHILAHGFANTAVGYGHLNKYGHAIIAEELAKVIQGVEE